jgi:hypothetical protein
MDPDVLDLRVRSIPAILCTHTLLRLGYRAASSCMATPWSVQLVKQARQSVENSLLSQKYR